MSSRISKKEIIKEIIKCGKDPDYFLNNYAKIQHPTKGLLPFKVYNYQADLVKAFVEHRMNLILKARQLGITTIVGGYIAWLILFHRDKNVLVVATKQDTAKNTVRVVKNIFKYLPKWMMSVGKIEINNRNGVELSNGSRVKAMTTTSDVGRSEALSLLFVDEVAHIDKFEEIWTGLGPTISAGGRLILASTPFGQGNWFHTEYIKAKEGNNNFNCRFGTYDNPTNPKESYSDRLMWWTHPEHDEVWFESETKGKSPRDVAQEFLCNFNASGDTFIFHEDLARLQREVKEPNHHFHMDRGVWIWEMPEKNGSYIIACDVSRGDASDFSAFHVIRLDGHPLEQVAEYKGKIRPDQLGMLLMSVSQFYNNAVIAPENNSGWSGQTILKIEEANYPFLYYSRRRQPKLKSGYAVDPYYASGRNDYLPGYSVTSGNRIQMLAKMEQYIRMKDIKLNSSRTLAELETFIVNEFSRPEASRGSHDDLVMALAGALWVREDAFMYTHKTGDMAKAMLDGMQSSNTSTNEFKDLNFSSNMYDRSRISDFIENQNKIKMGDGSVVDLNWLLRDPPITSG